MVVPSLASRHSLWAELAGREIERLVTHVNIPQRLCQDSGKTTSELSCGVRQVTAHHNDLARGAYEKDGRRLAMGKAAKYMGYMGHKSLWEEQNLAVKGILSGSDVSVTA